MVEHTVPVHNADPDRGQPVPVVLRHHWSDLVRDGENGLLVEPREPAALADALVRVLSDRALAERLAAAGRRSVEPWIATADDYASAISTAGSANQASSGSEGR